jgi:Omp85 superfamily domain
MSMITSGSRGLWLALCILLSPVSFAFAQSATAQPPPTTTPQGTGGGTAASPARSRAETLRQEREEKERTLTPYERNGLESTMHFIEEQAIFFLSREGFYPKLGSLTTGSGFAGGVGYRNSAMFDRHGTLDVYGAGSIKKYWALEARATFPRLANDRLFVQFHVGRREYPEEDYFGLGPDSIRSDQVSYLVSNNTFGGRVGVRPAWPVLIGGGVDYLQPYVGEGRDSAVPTIGELFDETTAPGLTRQPDYLRTVAFLEVDYREPRYARKGGWYRVEFSHVDDRDFDAYTFNRLDVDLRQFVGFLGERRVLAGRVWMSTSDTSDGQQMPFYYMPYLGGNDTLRGFREYRFRGPHALLMQAEYRIEIWSGLDLALFYDTGKVAVRRGDLDLSDLEDDYGFGFRFNTNNGVVMRVDAGFGSRDGKHLYITFGGVF